VQPAGPGARRGCLQWRWRAAHRHVHGSGRLLLPAARPPGDAETSTGGNGCLTVGRVGARVPRRDTWRRELPRSSMRVSASRWRVASGAAASGSGAALGARAGGPDAEAA
jgi:hypothetical protein